MDAILLLIRLGGDGSSEEKEAMSAIVYILCAQRPFLIIKPPIQNCINLFAIAIPPKPVSYVLLTGEVLAGFSYVACCCRCQRCEQFIPAETLYASKLQ